MNFESAQKAAERLNVSVRAVQKWAKEGRIPGAHKIGRDWMIPLDIEGPSDLNTKLNVSSNKGISSLLNIPFKIGGAKAYIETLDDKDVHDMMLAEYYYYSGQNAKATEIAEVYLNSEDFNVRHIAALICVFANLSLGHIHMTRYALNIIQSDLTDDMNADITEEQRALGVFVASVSSILLQFPVEGKPLLSKYMIYLPEGMKVFSAYILAQKAYLERNYESSYSIVKTTLNLFGEKYPLPAIYLYLMAAINLVNLQRVEEAEEMVEHAYRLAKLDDFVQVFGAHHALLIGLNERVFKKKDISVYNKLIENATNFGKGWIHVHNADAHGTIASNLNSFEFTVAMLFNRNWRVKEIAYHLDISERTVKNYLSVIYEKLDITSRKELRQYMLQ